MIAEPPSAGATQLMTTLVPEIVVVGDVGVFGDVAASAGIVAPVPSIE